MTQWEGRSGAELAALLELPRVEVFDAVTSTLDVAHELAAEGAPPGTLVLADTQTAGRGRQGRSWRSEPGRGVWLALIERPGGHTNAGPMSVVSLRIGLGVAPALDLFSDDAVLLKWPNDVYGGARKLAGTLLEARWRAGRLDWLAVGFGINVRPPDGVAAAALRPGTSRLAVLRAIVPALRAAVALRGPLSEAELARWNERDLARGRSCVEPIPGRVSGIGADGAIHIETPAGRSTALAGSLVLQEEREEALP